MKSKYRFPQKYLDMTLWLMIKCSFRAFTWRTFRRWGLRDHGRGGVHLHREALQADGKTLPERRCVLPICRILGFLYFLQVSDSPLPRNYRWLKAPFRGNVMTKHHILEQ